MTKTVIQVVEQIWVKMAKKLLFSNKTTSAQQVKQQVKNPPTMRV